MAVEGREESLACEEGIARAEVQKTGVSVRKLLAEAHGTQLCKAKDFFAILGVLALVGTAAWLIGMAGDGLVQFAEWVVDLGVAGHFLFFALFIWVGLPFGYNWSTLCILVGFAYGWTALLDIYVGTVCSATFSFFWARRCCKSCVASRLRAMSEKKRLYLRAAKMVIESRKAGFLMLVVIRVNPVLTFGFLNAFFGAWCDVHILKFALTTFLGAQYGALSMTSVGMLVRQVGSLKSATASSANAWPLLVQVGVFFIMVVAVSFYIRYLTVRVLPAMIAADATVDLEEEGSEHDSNVNASVMRLSPEMIAADATVDEEEEGSKKCGNAQASVVGNEGCK